jgi:hypothetical protein
MIPYLARLLNITINNDSIPSDCETHNGSLVSIYSPFTLTSVVSKQMKHVIA